MKRPSGRPKGSHPVRRAAIEQAVNTALMPYAGEILQRAVAQALQGGGLALSALVELLGRAMRPDAKQRAPAEA